VTGSRAVLDTPLEVATVLKQQLATHAGAYRASVLLHVCHDLRHWNAAADVGAREQRSVGPEGQGPCMTLSAASPLRCRDRSLQVHDVLQDWPQAVECRLRALAQHQATGPESHLALVTAVLDAYGPRLGTALSPIGGLVLVTAVCRAIAEARCDRPEG